MPVSLVAARSPVRCDDDADVEAVFLFSLGGLNLSFCLLHLFPHWSASALVLLSSCGG